MGGLERRLRRLEARAEAAELTENDRERHAIQEAIRSLSMEDLHSLDRILSADLAGADSDPMDLYELADERGRLALDRFERALAYYLDRTRIKTYAEDP